MKKNQKGIASSLLIMALLFIAVAAFAFFNIKDKNEVDDEEDVVAVTVLDKAVTSRVADFSKLPDAAKAVVFAKVKEIGKDCAAGSLGKITMVSEDLAMVKVDTQCGEADVKSHDFKKTGGTWAYVDAAMESASPSPVAN
jgi:hypothetical protein